MNGETFPPAAWPAAPDPGRRRFLGLAALACTGDLVGCVSQPRAAAVAPAMYAADFPDRAFSHSLGVRRLPDSKLFWPEKHPDVIAEEARKLWRETA